MHAAATLFYLAKHQDALSHTLLENDQHHDFPAKITTAKKMFADDVDDDSLKPTFLLEIVREPIQDKNSNLVAQYLGEKNPSEWVIAKAYAQYGAEKVSLQAHQQNLRRNKNAESLAVQQLKLVGLSSLDSSPMLRFLHSVAKVSKHFWFPQIAPSLAASYWHLFRDVHEKALEKQGWSIQYADDVGYQVYDADVDSWQQQVLESTEDAGWFELSVGVEIAGQKVDLLPILAKLLENDFLEETLDRPDSGFIYAPLPDGSALRMPIGRVRKIMKHLSAFLDPKFYGKVKIHALDAALLATNENVDVKIPISLHELTHKLHHFSGIKNVAAPEGLRAEMRDYQLTGFQWMQFLAEHSLHGILADDMGLGKTLQTIAHILLEKNSGRSAAKPALVVAPTSVVSNWRAEIVKFAPSLRTLNLTGASRSKSYTSIPYADVVLTSFALLQRDVKKLAAYEFHIVVLDEAQYIKNPRAKVSQAACEVRARHRLCLSGTPIENHLGELWSLMRFLMPGFLGTEKNFTAKYRTAIEKNEDSALLSALKRRVAPLILRRTKDQVAKELPPKTELLHFIELHSDQKDLYETIRATMNKRVREAIAARGMEHTQILFLDALLKLRQICCAPALLPSDLSRGVLASAKLDYLVELLETLLEEGRRILLFSQFTSMLEIIRAHLEKQNIGYLLLTGASKDRGALVEKFQSGKIPLFLISLKAGGTGLNLTAADTVIHYDPWWNPAAEAQATDRAYRIGQTQPVFVHKLLCENTVEQRIHLLQQSKAKLAGNILSNADSAAKLTNEILRDLLGD